GDIEARWQRWPHAVEIVQGDPRGLERVGRYRALDLQLDCAIAARIGDGLVAVEGVADGRDVAQPHRFPARPRDDLDRAEGRRIGRAAERAQLLLDAAAQRARGQVAGRGRNPLRDIAERQPEAAQLALGNLDPYLRLAKAAHRDPVDP